jgi:hypothetical protein
MPATVRCRRTPRLELLTVRDQDASARFGTRESHCEWPLAVPRRAEALKQMLRQRCDGGSAQLTVRDLTL